jgi:hypothetical protein
VQKRKGKKLENIKTIRYKLDTNIIEMKFFPSELNFYFNVLENTPKKIVLGLKRQYYFFDYVFQGNIGTEYTLSSNTQNISQGTVTEAYTSSFPLTEIDDLREYILSKGREKIVVGRNSDEKLKSNFIYKVLFPENYEETDKDKIIYPIINMEMGGLCLKTHQSDLFNNWVNKEWVDGDNGINAVTDVDVSDGKLNLDALNLAQKVYNMLNRIAISGGSYKDWIETVYTTDYYFRAETPIYEGGMSTTIDFEAVVSNSASTASGIEEPFFLFVGIIVFKDVIVS